MNIHTGTLLWHKALTGVVPRGIPADSPLAEQLSAPSRGDRGAWAEMRRCRTVGEALLAEPFALYLRFVTTPDKRSDLLRSERRLAGLARAAIVVSRVRSVDLTGRFGAQMGSAKGPQPPTNTGRPRVPKMIAKALFQADDPDEALDITLNAVELVGDVNIVDLAFGMINWPKRAERWAITYYESALALEAS